MRLLERSTPNTDKYARERAEEHRRLPALQHDINDGGLEMTQLMSIRPGRGRHARRLMGKPAATMLF